MEKQKIKELVKELIKAIGENPEREGLKNTPDRVAKMYEKIFSGIGRDPKKEIRVYRTKNYDEIIMVKNISFYSMCEHHLLPFFGKVHIAYIPKDNRITGFSNIIGVVDSIASRLQIQERMTAEIADILMEILKPMGVFVIVEARQLCLEMQGLKKTGETTVTSAIRGAFKRESTRLEALSLIKEETG